MQDRALFLKEMVFTRPTISPPLPHVRAINVKHVKRIKSNPLFGLILILVYGTLLRLILRDLIVETLQTLLFIVFSGLIYTLGKIEEIINDRN